MSNVIYQYEPYVSQEGAEIPCFRIYMDGQFVAQTNEDLPADVQEKVALLFVKYFS